MTSPKEYSAPNNDGWIPDPNSFYNLDIDVFKNGDIVDIRKENIKKADLIGAEIIGIAEDDLGDIFRYKLKDGRIVVLIQEDDGSAYLVMTDEQRRESSALLQ